MTKKHNPLFISSKQIANQIIDRYDNFLLDCDGVIWLDEKLIPGVIQFLQYLTKHGKNYTFVTNNSSSSRQDYISKFERLGLPNISKESIYPTSYSAALELKKLNIPEGSKIWCLSDNGIKQEMEELGYIPLGVNDPKLNKKNLDSSILRVDPDVKAVVVGSTEQSYMRVSATLQYLLYNNKTLPFITSNIDRLYPGPDGIPLPAESSVYHYVAWLSQRTDYINVGKPSGEFLDLILEDNHYDRNKTIMIGDTLYTDIKFGNDGNLGNGQSSLLVLSGGTTLNDLKDVVEHSKDESLIPSFYIQSLGQLVDLLE
ncbi:hypothetical protein KGF54_001872 [Candida jiufengensis]|uniref:uncharacterized protein n=1 Tax=Candida jiufengensis TaxID=497108 RepID=UPI00222521A9|nr:uncharacterized protein KGF54_001872 [Candida jiufengensis]KAI5955311.1 hypothetical protein KGF54_001872 [Candida jiufengensis]